MDAEGKNDKGIAPDDSDSLVTPETQVHRIVVGIAEFKVVGVGEEGASIGCLEEVPSPFWRRGFFGFPGIAIHCKYIYTWKEKVPSDGCLEPS